MHTVSRSYTSQSMVTLFCLRAGAVISQTSFVRNIFNFYTYTDYIILAIIMFTYRNRNQFGWSRLYDLNLT